MAPISQTKPRRPKSVNYGHRRTLRFGTAEEAAVLHMRYALAQLRGVEVEKIPFSEGLRLLLTENVKAAQILAGKPEALPYSQSIELPLELWDALADCRNRLSHSQGSLYTIMRKLNFAETVTAAEVRDAFEAVQKSKGTLARLEERVVEFLGTFSSGAVAEDEAEGV